MEEHEYYNLHSSANRAIDCAEGATNLTQRLMVMHLRLEHKMPLHLIAKRIKISMNWVKKILKDE